MAARPLQIDAQVERDPSLVEHERPVRKKERFVHIMRDEKHGRPVGAPERPDQLLGLETGEGIERRERLVEGKQLRLAHQGAGERCALGFATR